MRSDSRTRAFESRWPSSAAARIARTTATATTATALATIADHSSPVRPRAPMEVPNTSGAARVRPGVPSNVAAATADLRRPDSHRWYHEPSQSLNLAKVDHGIHASPHPSRRHRRLPDDG